MVTLASSRARCTWAGVRSAWMRSSSSSFGPFLAPIRLQEAGVASRYRFSEAAVRWALPAGLGVRTCDACNRQTADRCRSSQPRGAAAPEVRAAAGQMSRIFAKRTQRSGAHVRLPCAIRRVSAMLAAFSRTSSTAQSGRYTAVAEILSGEELVSIMFLIIGSIVVLVSVGVGFVLGGGSLLLLLWHPLLKCWIICLRRRRRRLRHQQSAQGGEGLPVRRDGPAQAPEVQEGRLRRSLQAHVRHPGEGAQGRHARHRVAHR